MSITTFYVADYGETKIKWKTKTLSESAEFSCGGTHKHLSDCIVGNFETKHKSPNNGLISCVSRSNNEKRYNVV